MKTLTGVFALMFALMLGASNVFAADAPGGTVAAPTKAQIEACKHKKEGDKVKVDGKDYTCPKPAAKEEKKK